MKNVPFEWDQRSRRRRATVTGADLVRAQRMSASMQRYLTLLTERPVSTALAEHGPAPAWSTESTVTFALDQLGDLARAERIVSVKGLTLHEAAHIMFSPRAGGDLVTWVHEVQRGTFAGFDTHVSEQFPGREGGPSLLGLFDAYNVLEDQRIETALIGRFGSPVIPWLTATAAQHLLAGDDALLHAHPFIWGRTYLPLDLRLTARELYRRGGHAGRLSEIIDEYRALGHPELRIDRARQLIIEFAALVAYGARVGTHVCSDLPVDRHGPSATSAPTAAEEQAALLERGRAVERAVLGDASDADYDPEAPYGSAEAASELRRRPVEELTRKARRAVTTARAEALRAVDREQRHDAAIYRSRFDQRAAPRPGSLPGGRITAVDPTLDAIAGARRFGRELEGLRIEHEAAWDRRTRSGRINVARYLRGAELDEAFDRWELGRDDAVDIEMVVALDCSGSMEGSPIAEAAQAMWALKRAVDRVEGDCTVVTFNHESHVLHGARSRAGRHVLVPRAGGGTDPYDALVHAERLLSTSTRAVRLLVVITDGEWFDRERAEGLIADLRDDGVLTALITMGAVADADGHGCEIRHVTGDADSLLRLGRDLVRVAIARNLTRKAA